MSLDSKKKEGAEGSARRKTKRTREQIEENGKQRDILKKQHDDLTRELEEQQDEQRKLGDKKALGMKVTHKKFGKGKVAVEDGKYIEVAFQNLTKTFVLPGAIAGGFLLPDDEGLIEYYKKSAAIHERIQKTELQLRSNGFAMERLEEQLEKLEGKA
ncbi:MAG: hypothetical protein IKO80_07645 [Lachnospiraceae bacterium]|nr:hypothetical protein [Lachnospiraceae bacterium]